MNQVTILINKIRLGRGLGELKEHPALFKSAQAHSEDMSSGLGLSHNSSDGSSPFQRMTAAGYTFTFAGECIAEGQKSAQDVVDAWMDDGPHRRILLGHYYHHIGIGDNQSFWTADFAAGMDDPTPLPNKIPDESFNLW